MRNGCRGSLLRGPGPRYVAEVSLRIGVVSELGRALYVHVGFGQRRAVGPPLAVEVDGQSGFRFREKLGAHAHRRARRVPSRQLRLWLGAR